MKRTLIALALFTVVSPALAGMTYQFNSVTTGRGGGGVTGKAFVEGPNMRMEITTGDGLFFTADSVLLSRDGMKTLSVLNTKEKTYFDFSIEELLNMAGNVMKSMGGMMELAVENPSVEMSSEGDGGMIEGYPTKKILVKSSYSLNMKIMGMKTSQMIKSETESWVTDKIGQENTSFFQLRGLKSGMPELDKLIAAETAEVKGFPLKVVRTQTTMRGDKRDTNTTTTTVTNIQKGPIASEQFTIPAGYTKSESPMEQMPKMQMQKMEQRRP